MPAMRPSGSDEAGSKDGWSNRRSRRRAMRSMRESVSPITFAATSVE